MPVIKSFRTDGDNFLRKTLTTGDNNHQGAVQYYEKMAGSDGTTNTVFTLAIPYAQSTNSLMVFVNGQKVEKVTTATDTTEYQETSSTVITFGAALLDTDVVEFYIVSGIITNDYPDQLFNGTTSKLQSEPNGATLTGELGKSGTDVCAFFVYLAAAKNDLSSGTAQNLQLDTADYDLGSDVTLGVVGVSDCTFTAPYTGRYHFDMAATFKQMQTGSTGVFIYAVVSSGIAPINRIDPDVVLSGTSALPLIISFDLSLTAADTVKPTVWVTDIATADLQNYSGTNPYCWFSGHFIG
jgi:hypothetical protein